jgi:hypothetical protein
MAMMMSTLNAIDKQLGHSRQPSWKKAKTHNYDKEAYSSLGFLYLVEKQDFMPIHANVKHTTLEWLAGMQRLKQI